MKRYSAVVFLLAFVLLAPAWEAVGPARPQAPDGVVLRSLYFEVRPVEGDIKEPFLLRDWSLYGPR
jgi:hypothetical protein